MSMQKQSTIGDLVASYKGKTSTSIYALLLIGVFILSTIIAATQDTRRDPLSRLSILETLIYPQEENAFLRLPVVEGALYDVFVLPNTSLVWAVGEKGLILHSQDAGESWVRQDFPTMSASQLTFFSSDTENTDSVEEDLNNADQSEKNKPVREKGIAYASSENEAEKSELNINNEQVNKTALVKPNLSGVKFYDENLGFIIGNYGGILRTRDGGKQWEFLTGEKENLKSARDISYNQMVYIELKDEKTIYALGYGEDVQSHDGGNTWTLIEQNSTLREELGKKYIAEKEQDMPIMELFVDRDGSGYFSQQFLNGLLWSVDKLANGDAILVNQKGCIIKYAALLESWRQVARCDVNDFVSVKYSSLSNAYAVDQLGNVFRSDNSGKTWNIISEKVSDKVLVIDAFDEKNLIIFTEEGTIFTSDDGGAHWIPYAGELSIDLLTITDGIGFAISSSGASPNETTYLYRSSDKGKSWQRINRQVLNVDNVINIMSTPDGNIYAIGESVSSSDDKGLTWKIKDDINLEERGEYIIIFLSDKNIIAAGFGVFPSKISDDGGKTWRVVNDRDLKHTLFAQGEFILVRDDIENDIYASMDGGENWSISFDDNGYTFLYSDFYKNRYGVLVGDFGNIIFTKDGAKNWQGIKYRRHPPLWYWIFSAFIVVLLSILLKIKLNTKKESPEESIADLLASDRPLQPGDPDPLGYSAIARGLSRFMRNPSTEPPLTLAITGAWGTGKSSLMNLLYADLKKFGFTPVWFNAWHHQKGEQLLASLYANIREQAVPGWLHFSQGRPIGLQFHLNILGRRVWNNKTMSMTILIITAFIYSYLFSGGDFDTIKINETLNALADPQANWDKVMLTLFGGLGPFAVLLRGMRAFGINPINLIANHEKANKASFDPGARQTFAKEFGDVAQSLDLGRMVIFIDDLDRCSKENVVDILESINFLSVSGDCYIILGMDEAWVKICIEQHFPDMKENNHAFAEQYLEKMINIKVPVPQLDAAMSESLLVPDETFEDKKGFSFVKYFHSIRKYISAHVYMSSFIGIILFALILSPKIEVLQTLGENNGIPEPQEVKIQTWENIEISDLSVINGEPNIYLSLNEGIEKQKTSDRGWELSLSATTEALDKGIVLGQLGDKNSGAKIILKKSSGEDEEKQEEKGKVESRSIASNSASSTVQSQEKRKVDFKATEKSEQSLISSLPALTMLLILALFIYHNYKKDERRPEDSNNFKQALGIWHPWIMLNRQTPRAIKRYLNRVRYIAMRYRPEEQSADEAISSEEFEPTLVALSAILAIDESWVRDPDKYALIEQGRIQDLVEKKYLGKDVQSEQLISAVSKLNDCITQHKQAFSRMLVSTTEEREKFLDIMAITHVS